MSIKIKEKYIDPKIVLKEVQDGLFLFTTLSGFINCTLIVSSEGLIVIDSLYFPEDAQKVAQYIQKKFSKPLLFLINTHWHSDHIYGNQYFSPVEKIIAQQNYQETFKKERSWVMSRSPVRPDKIKLIYPNLLVKDKLNLRVGEFSIELISLPGHSSDSLLIYLPQIQWAATGDTLIHGRKGTQGIPYFYWGDINELKRSLGILQEMKIENFIPGHGDPVGKEKLASDLYYLDSIEKQFREIFEADSKFSFKNPELARYQLAQKIPLVDCLNHKKKVEFPIFHEFNLLKLAEFLQLL